MNITIIGLGLIGGSFAKDLKSQINVQVYGVDNLPEHGMQALELGLVHQVVDLQQGLEIADLVIMAIPVDKIEAHLASVLDRVTDHTTVVDVGSTKEKICTAIRNHPRRGRYVAAHPLAGTEFSGPAAAIPKLFYGKKNIVCERDLSDPDALELALRVFESVGLTTYFLDPKEHDKHLAYVSHLSHVSSFMLGLTVLDIEKDEKQIFNLASTGFASTVRLAKSNPFTWSAIFDKNNYHLSTALDSYIRYLQQFKEAIDNRDRALTEKLMSEANDIKRILN